MGIALRNREVRLTEGVVGDGTNKTIIHDLGSVPSFVQTQDRAAGAASFVVSKSAANVVVQGASGTFDVLIEK